MHGQPHIKTTSYSCNCISAPVSPSHQKLNPRDNVCKAAPLLLLINNKLRLGQFNPIIWMFTVSATTELSIRLKKVIVLEINNCLCKSWWCTKLDALNTEAPSCNQCCREKSKKYHTFCGSTVVKVLFYKPEGRWFDPSWCHWNFSLTWNPSDHTMALGSSQRLTEMSTRRIS